MDIVRACHKDEEDDDDDEDEEPIPTVTETRNALNSLKRGLLERGFVDHNNQLTKLEKASSQILTAELKQTTIFRFFGRSNFFTIK